MPRRNLQPRPPSPRQRRMRTAAAPSLPPTSKLKRSPMAYAHDATPYGHGYPGFFTRWFCSTNHKDIGSLYLIFAVCAGLIGGFMSLLFRIQLSHPGNEFLDHQTYNVIVTAHGLIMIFF